MSTLALAERSSSSSAAGGRVCECSGTPAERADGAREGGILFRGG